MASRSSRAHRLRRPAEFAAVLAAPRAQSLRAVRHWLSMTAAWSPSAAPGVRFGATVGKRNARRAIDRALVKRILREAGRHALPTLQAVCERRRLAVDVSFRLRAARAAATDGAPTSTRIWRQALRAEADGLLERLAQHLSRLPD